MRAVSAVLVLVWCGVVCVLRAAGCVECGVWYVPARPMSGTAWHGYGAEACPGVWSMPYWGSMAMNGSVTFVGWYLVYVTCAIGVAAHSKALIAVTVPW